MNSDDLTRELHRVDEDDNETRKLKCVAVILFIGSLHQIQAMKLTKEQENVLRHLKGTYINEFKEANKNELN